MAAASTFSFNSEPAIVPVKTKARNMVFIVALRGCRVITSPFFLAVWIAAFTYSGAFGQDAKTAEAVRLITETAAQICQTAPLEQTNTGYELSGEAKAKVSGLVGKIADLSISGGGSAQSGHSVGVLEKDLPSVILSTHNCKLQVFLTLERDLLGEHTKKSAPGIEPENNVSELPVNFSIPNSEQYCLRLKKIIDSAKKSFEPIIGILDEFIGGFKPKVELPDMEWCYINTLSVGKK